MPRTFLYRCPNTRQNVQGWSADEVTDDDDTYQSFLLRLPQCWFNPRCRGGEHTAQEAWSCNRSLGND